MSGGCKLLIFLHFVATLNVAMSLTCVNSDELLDEINSMESLVSNNYSMILDALKDLKDELKKNSMISQKLNDIEIPNLPTVSETPNYDAQFNCIANCSGGLRLPKKCDSTFKEGIYLFEGEKYNLRPFYAYFICDYKKSKMVHIVIQNRQNELVSFNRNWNDYKNGFGNLNADYWLGLERLHKLTADNDIGLWISMSKYQTSDESCKHAEAYYENFAVRSEANEYRLMVVGYSSDPEYKDSMKFHDFKNFSTFDHDNNHDTDISCARQEDSGWWFADCYTANLNGVYQSSANKWSGKGIHFYGWTLESLERVSMAVRPLF